MEQNDEFIRVGTTYYKIVDQPLVNGETVKRRIPWSIEALRQDYGKNFIADIPKYDGFCTVPNHLDYNREVGTFYNLYEPITHQLEAGQFPRIKSLMEHIFGEQYGLGMDYLQLLYEKPTLFSRTSIFRRPIPAVQPILRKVDILAVVPHCT